MDSGRPPRFLKEAKFVIPDPIDDRIARMLWIAAVLGNPDGQTHEQVQKVFDEVQRWAIDAGLWYLVKEGQICVSVIDEEVIIRAATPEERRLILDAGDLK
jgi:hypothetical protein